MLTLVRGGQTLRIRLIMRVHILSNHTLGMLLFIQLGKVAYERDGIGASIAYADAGIGTSVDDGIGHTLSCLC